MKTTLYGGSNFTVEEMESDENDTILNYGKNYTVCGDVYQPHVFQFDFWISHCCLTVVCVLGIMGNLLSMLILSRPQMKSSISAVLFGLACCDTVLLICSILLFSLTAVYPYTGYLWSYYYFWYPTMSPFLFPIAMTAQTSSAYLTITVSFERFLVVHFPLQSRRWLNFGRARIYVILIIIFSIVFNLPRLLETWVRKRIDPEYGEVYCVDPSALRTNDIYKHVYIHWMYFIVNCLIPFVTLIFFNIMIYRQVRKANRERLRLSRSEKREIGLAVMLMAVVIVFLLCNILALILNVLEVFFGVIQIELNTISNLLVNVNSSVNFIIYVIFGEKFKRIFCMMLCKSRMAKREDALRDDSTYSGENSRGSQRNSSRSGFQRDSFIRYKAQKRPTLQHNHSTTNPHTYTQQTSLEGK